MFDFGGIQYVEFLLSIYSLISFVPYALSARITLPLISTFDNTSTATVQSDIFPPVKMNFTGLPSPSTMAWIFVFFPPRDKPISWFVSEFSAPFLHQRRADAL